MSKKSVLLLLLLIAAYAQAQKQILPAATKAIVKQH